MHGPAAAAPPLRPGQSRCTILARSPCRGVACRKRKSGLPKVLQDHGTVLAVAALLLALCGCVALRGNASHWKKEALEMEKHFHHMEKRFSDLQITASHMRVRGPPRLWCAGRVAAGAPRRQRACQLRSAHSG